MAYIIYIRHFNLLCNSPNMYLKSLAGVWHIQLKHIQGKLGFILKWFISLFVKHHQCLKKGVWCPTTATDCKSAFKLLHWKILGNFN